MTERDRPDEISVIDYVDSDSEFYNNGIEISRIWRKLKGGVAILGLQKKSDIKISTEGGEDDRTG